jgi:hypothetical protein
VTGRAAEPPGDKVRVTVFVEVSPEDAFEVFTTEIDQWWRRGPAYRIAGRAPGVLHLEPRLGGRIFEQYGERQAALHEVGTITAWEPPRHLAFDWRSVTFVDGEATSVEVWFEASGQGTRVTLEHRGWAGIRGDHPVRHGKEVPEFLADLGRWWGALMSSLREHAAGRGAV